MVSKTIINGDNTSNALQGTGAADVIYGFTAHSQTASIQATKIASYTLPRFKTPVPLAITASPSDPGHLFVADRTAIIKVGFNLRGWNGGRRRIAWVRLRSRLCR